MRNSLKKCAVTALAASLALGLSIPAYAADNRDKISTVRLKITSCDEPLAGEDVGSVTVEADSTQSKYEVVSSEFYDTRDDVWERGETPVVRVELKVKDGEVDNNRFYYTSSSKIRVSGFHSEFKSAKVLDGGDGLRVDIKLRAVSGDLQDIDDLYWDGRTAQWSEVDDADKYEVKLYRNGSTVTTVTTSSSHFNFYPYMTRSGDYSFKVRAVSNSDGEKSEWTDESDDYYMSSGDVYTGTPPTSNNYTGSNGSGGSGPTGGGPTGGVGGIGWVQDIYGWYYLQSNNARVANNWLFVDNNWFHFNALGYMETGWIFADNNWFYLNPVSNGTRGAMMTGLQYINGAWYYLNPVSDGTRGARMTGFQNINGNWYLFDPSSGVMYMNRAVPGNQWAGADGIIR